MIRKSMLLALVCVTAIAGAQPRSAISTAKNTADAAKARNAAIVSEQQAAVAGQKAATPDSAQQPATMATAGSPAAAQRAVPTITREVYQYDGGGRRDPFLSLSRTGALRPHISELQLVIVMVGAADKGVATIVDKSTKERYLVKVGDLLGRYRVVRIEAKAVTFAIEEFGYSRQERLAFGDTSNVRNQ